MIQRSITLLFVFCLLLPLTETRAAGPIAVEKIVEKSVSQAAAAGQKGTALQRERSGLIQEIQNAELQLEWARFQLEKTERWIDAEQKNSAILTENLQQAQKTKDRLAPFLEVLYADLETHVRGDLPFHQQERQRRLAHIRQSLDDPDASLSDKIGRLLEALQVEREYGYTVDVTEEVMDTGEGLEQVTQFRLGRLTLFRLLKRGERAQRYNRETAAWDEVPQSCIAEIVHGIEIARKKRVTSVLSLPIGSFTELSELEGGNES